MTSALERLIGRAVETPPDSLSARGPVLDDLRVVARASLPADNAMAQRVFELGRSFDAHVTAQREFGFAAPSARTPSEPK